MNKDGYLLSTKEVLENLNSSNKGLTSSDAEQRLKEYGLNVIPKQKQENIFQIIFRELTEPIVLVLLVTILISFLANEIVDALAIIFIVMIDLVIGTYQEMKARKSAQALENMLKVKAKVLRDGEQIEIDASQLVPGDIVFLESGTKISADARVIDVNNLSVDESALTGESLSVSKVTKKMTKNTGISGQNNMVFAGTSVLSGRALVVVVKTGIETEIGKIADTVSTTKEEKSPLSIRMDRFTKQISIIIVFIAIIIAIILFMKDTGGKEIFLTVVALAVSAMPEGLPLALTMALTIGSTKMVKKKVIVKNLNAVESLGSCTVIASDKTGTLTKNQQTAKVIMLPNDTLVDVTGTGYNDDGKIIFEKKSDEKSILHIAKMGLINNESTISKEENEWHFIGDSIDIAFSFLGHKANVETDDIEIITQIPYESVNKYSAVFFKSDDKYYCTIKGSFEVVGSFCEKMLKNNREVNFNEELIKNQNDSLSKDGYRVIAIATASVEKKNKYTVKDIKNLVFRGLVGFIDPVRNESVEAIKTCKKAGIKVLMITGDHPLTAYKIASDLKLVNNDKEIATGDELEQYYNMGEEEFDKFISNKKVFARVTPIDKFNIIESLKRQGEFVAVTGDGVNDAPALKTANIGIAMGSGTDVAKEVSSMILVNDDFSSIVNGIKEGRTAYTNIRKICYFLLSCGLTEVLFFLFAIIFNMPVPLVAIQLLWLNVVTDGLQDLALSFENASNNIMKEKPRSTKESIFNKEMFKEVTFSATYISIIIFALWVILLNVVKMDVDIARGYVMALMVFVQNMHVLNCRSEKESVFVYRNKNPFIIFSIIGAILLQIIIMEVPLLSNFLKTSSIPIADMFVLFFISTSVIIVMEIYKYFNYQKEE